MSYCDHLPSVICLSVCPSTPLNNFSETLGPIFFKLHVEHSVKGGLKICSNGHGHGHGPLRWPPCPYMVKTLKNLLQNQESFKVESCI